MTDAVHMPTEPSTPDAIRTLSPMVVRPATFEDTLRTLCMVLAIAAVSVFAAAVAWRWFLVSPLPDDALEIDTIGAVPARLRTEPPRIELEVSVRRLGTGASDRASTSASTAEPDPVALTR